MRGVWLLLLLTGCCSAQQGEYVLAGSVVNSRTGEPVKRALVTAIGAPVDSAAESGSPAKAVPPFVATVFTDVSGAFRFTGLAGGTYNLSAQKPHFTEPPTARVPIHLGSSSKDDVRIELSPLGTIEGKITDQRGQPVPAASIMVMQTSVVDGRRQNVFARNVWTDDRGIFRVWDMPPGRYLIKATGRSGMTFAYPDEVGPSNGGFLGFVPAYFGGPTVHSATPVVMESGGECRADIGVSVQPAHKVRGTLANVGPGDVEFALLSGDEDVGAGRVNFSRATGAFEMLEVVNGSYTLRATQGNQAIAETPVTVEGDDVNGLRMGLAGPIEIPVNIRILNQPEMKTSQESRSDQSGEDPGGPRNLADEMSSSSQMPGSCSIVLVAAGPYPQLTGSQNETDGPVSALPGSYRVEVDCNEAYRVSVAMGSTDLVANPSITVLPGVAPAPIEVVARHGGGNITGFLKLDRAPAGKIICVLAVPGDSTRDPVVAQVFEQSGSQFFFNSLAPGDYALYAFSTDQIEYRNPEFLRGLSGGESVHAEDGVTATVNIARLVQ